MFLQYLSAITLVQSTFRAMIARQRWHTITCCTRKIQRNWRLCTFRKLQNESATMIQANWRCKASHSSFRLTLSSTIIIQTRWRSSREYKKYSALRFSAVSVQACWRRYSARLNYELDILEIVIAQSVVRRMLAQIAAKKRQQSLKILQNFLRRLLALTTMRHLRYQHDEFVRRCRAAIIIQVCFPISNI